MKKGFTIIELLTVIAILAVLFGIITAAATASIRQSRERQAQAMKQTLQNGIAAYRVRDRKGRWPEELRKCAEKDQGSIVYLSDGQCDNVMSELLVRSTGKYATKRVMDPMGLLVAKKGFADDKTGCSEFREATRKTGRFAKSLKPSELTAVYKKRETGKACRYVIEYNIEGDSVSVMTQRDFQNEKGREWGGSEEWH